MFPHKFVFVIFAFHFINDIQHSDRRKSCEKADGILHSSLCLESQKDLWGLSGSLVNFLRNALQAIILKFYYKLKVHM